MFDDATRSDVLEDREGATERAAIRRLIEACHVDTSSVASALGRGHRFDDVVDELARREPATLIEAVLPGLPDDLDVRAVHPVKYVSGWQGDLFVRPVVDGGVSATIGSRRGAAALAALTELQRAAITRYSMMPLDGEDARAIHEDLSELRFEGVQRVELGDIPSIIAARMIMHAPSLAAYGGAVDLEIAEALATTAVRTIWARSTIDGALERLAGARWLRELWLSCLDEGYRLRLPALLQFPALAELHVGYGKLDDDDIAVIAQIATLDELRVDQNPFGDRGGVSLAKLRRLRALDLHDTAIGDSTVIALAELPELTDLDLAATNVSAAGIRALARARSLKRLGLSWSVDAEISAEAERLGCALAWNDYYTGGGALWGAGFMGP